MIFKAGNDALPKAKPGRLSKCLLVLFFHARICNVVPYNCADDIMLNVRPRPW